MIYIIILLLIIAAIFWSRTNTKFSIDCSNWENIEKSVLYVYKKTDKNIIEDCKQKVRTTDSGTVTTWYYDEIVNTKFGKDHGYQSICSWNNVKFVHLYSNDTWFCTIEFKENCKPEISLILGKWCYFPEDTLNRNCISLAETYLKSYLNEHSK